jgi:hypothetical protein
VVREQTRAPVYQLGCNLQAYLDRVFGVAASAPLPVVDFKPDGYGEGRCLFPAPKDTRAKGKDVGRIKKKLRSSERLSDHEYEMRAARYVRGVLSEIRKPQPKNVPSLTCDERTRELEERSAVETSKRIKRERKKLAPAVQSVQRRAERGPLSGTDPWSTASTELAINASESDEQRLKRVGRLVQAA